MEEISVSRGRTPYFRHDARTTPLDEATCRAALAEAGRLDPSSDDEGILYVGTGNAFWQVELVRDGAGLVIALAGDHYTATFDDESGLEELYRAVRRVADRLDAQAWIAESPLSDAEILWRVGQGPEPEHDDDD
jgi:hypothetical protein